MSDYFTYFLVRNARGKHIGRGEGRFWYAARRRGDIVPFSDLFREEGGGLVIRERGGGARVLYVMRRGSQRSHGLVQVSIRYLIRSGGGGQKAMGSSKRLFRFPRATTTTDMSLSIGRFWTAHVEVVLGFLVLLVIAFSKTLAP